MKTNIIHHQDCVTGMKDLPEQSVDIVVTSPPYNLDIKYGSYQDDLPRDSYLKWLDDVFHAVKSCLKQDGDFFLNVGYSNIDPWVGMDVAQVARRHFVLQNNFTWVKSIYVDEKTHGHFKPINSQRFANPTWEHLFHFTPTGQNKCDKLAIGVPYEWDCNIDPSGRVRGRLAKKMGYENIRDFNARATDQEKQTLDQQVSDKMANRITSDKHCRGNSWFIPYDTIGDRSKDRGSHPATFPIGLVENCIKFSGKQEGLLLDPFMGSGTSGIGAVRNNLKFIGFEIDEDYINFAREKLRKEGIF